MGSVSLSFARGRLRLAATLVLLAAILLPALPLATPRSALATHTTIKLPFLGDGAWYAWEGYNFSPVNDGTHWDCDPNTGTDVPSHTIPCRPLYIYKYSFDLRHVDEQTAWQPVLAPADGTICWIDSGFGGAAIDFGDGYVFAYFHTRIAGGLAAGQHVTRGQFLGAVAPEGEAGNGGIAHLHINLWRSWECGGADRVSEPFTGDHKLDGRDFPALSDSVQNQHVNKQMTSTNTVTGSIRPTVPALSSPANGATLNTATPLLSWGVSTRAVEYRVVIDGTIKSPWIEARSWRPPDLAPGSHTWQVQGRNPLSTGSLSPARSFTVPGTVAKLTLSPATGRVNTLLSLTGSGYAAGERVALTWDSTSGQLLKTVTADSSGKFTASVRVPRTVKGDHRLIAKGQTSGREATAPFTVASARVLVTPGSGRVKSRVSIQGEGFGADEPVFVAWDGHILDFGDVSADANGTYFSTQTVPELPAGKRTIELIGEVSDQRGKVAFTVEPDLSISPTSGPAATQITVRGTGWPARQTVNITWQPPGESAVQVCTSTISTKGNLTCRFNAPADDPNLVYRVRATAGSYTIWRSFRLTGVSGAAVRLSPAPTATPTNAAPDQTAIVVPTTAASPTATPLPSETPTSTPTTEPSATPSPTPTATEPPLSEPDQTDPADSAPLPDDS